MLTFYTGTQIASGSEQYHLSMKTVASLFLIHSGNVNVKQRTKYCEAYIFKATVRLYLKST